MPGRYFVQTHRIDAATYADFFYLDTTPMLKEYFREQKTRNHVITQDTRKQLVWFKNSLAASTAPWKIVFAHHPIYSGGLHGDSPELIENILPLLERYQVQAFFNGHDHDLQHLQTGRINLFGSGAGSEFRPTTITKHSQFAKACSGFTAVSLLAGNLNVRMIDNHGKLLYTADVPRVPA
jgi:acid phosphatase